MSKKHILVTNKIVFSFLLLTAVSVLIFQGVKSTQNKKTITRYDKVTFNVPENWFIYRTNGNYDVDIGYFENNSKSNKLLCNINAITANLDRNPTFEQFLATTLDGRMLIDQHTEPQVSGNAAWEGSYAFPAKGIDEPTQNHRILFKWQGIYVDLKLSYSRKLEYSTQNYCEALFQSFQNKILLN